MSGGLFRRSSRHHPGCPAVGLLLSLGQEGDLVNAPIAPGYYRVVGVSGCRRVGFGEPTLLEGPGVLAFDGERERVLMPGQQARLTIGRTGPRVVDVQRAMQLATRQRCFRVPNNGRESDERNNGI